MGDLWLKNVVVLHSNPFQVTQLLDILPVERKEFLEIQEVRECIFVLKYICGRIKAQLRTCYFTMRDDSYNYWKY